MSDDSAGVTADHGDDTGRSTDGSWLAALASGVRIGQFVSVGAIGFVLEQTILAVATVAFALDPILAKVIGAEASISVMFLVNDRWTFADAGADDRSAIARRWLRSHSVRLAGLTVAFGVLFVLTKRTDITLVVFGQDFWPTVANGVGIVVGMGLNYVAESLFTWEIGR